MKKIKKFLACVLSAIVSATPMLSVPTNVSAAFDYLDPANVVWVDGDLHCFTNGEILDMYNTEYTLRLHQDENVVLTNELLGLPFWYSIDNDYVSKAPEQGEYKIIETETYEEACELSRLANAWIEDGIILGADILTKHHYACCDDIGFKVKFTDPDVEFDMAELGYEGLYPKRNGDELIVFIPNKYYTDYEYISGMESALAYDSRVESVSDYGIFCCVAHIIMEYDSILPPTYTLEELYNMSDEEFFYLDGAEEMYSQIENDVNSVYQLFDIVEYGGISGHLSAEYSNYTANATEQAIEKLLGDTVNYHINSPINIEVDDLFYEYQFDVFFTDMVKGSAAMEITEEDIIKMAKCYYCVNQVIDVHYWDCQYIGMPAPGDEPILAGDANFDKSVDVYDVIWVSNYIIENYNFTDAQKVIADVNDDGVVDVGDAVKVAMYVLNPESNPLE